MELYERIFLRLKELGMSQNELSKRTGIATSTISDWKKKHINPQVDKLIPLCKALNVSLADLLCEEKNDATLLNVDYVDKENYLIELYRNSSLQSKRNIIRYFELLEICKLINEKNRRKQQQRIVSVISDIDGNNIVLINDIMFKGKRSINWKDVKEYLKGFVGDFYTIASTGDVIYIGSDLPSEYSGSAYTYSIKGSNAKAKANASQGIPELIEIATGNHYRENNESKHWRNAKYGWYRYDSRFALPVYGNDGEVVRYNIFHTSLIVRHSEDNKLYLYDIIDIKKETSNPLEP